MEADALRTACAGALYNKQLQEWNEAANVEYTEAYESFDFRQFYKDLTNYRQETDFLKEETES